MKTEYVSFSKDWSNDDKMTILFALRRVNETEVADQKAQELYEEEANLGLFGKIKRNLI